MRILLAVIFICLIYSDLFSQDLVAWAPTTNNLTEGEFREHIITGVGAYISINNNGADGFANIQIFIFDDANILQNILVWGSSTTGGSALQGWKVEFHALSGQGSSCMDGGKDSFSILDDNFDTYDNPDHCVKLAPMPIRYQNQPIVKLQNNKTQVTWSVATQINNEKYIIEHSNDGRNFSTIGEITGDGTSNETKHYEYIHISPSIGMNYYRIKQVDFDGKYSFSDIASVRYDGSGETNIFPNPASSEVTITTTERTSLQIMDVYGKLHSKQEISEGQNTINISGLPCGILIFVVGDQRYKVLKE
jgi:hypothetical protein